MSIPVNALKDDELLHYAALDQSAASELARRIAENCIDPSAEREELREDIRRLESQASDDGDELASGWRGRSLHLDQASNGPGRPGVFTECAAAESARLPGVMS